MIEAAVGLLVLMIMVLGSLHYRYLTATEIRKAERQLVAADLAATALGTWQGLGGNETFDPETSFALDMTIAATDGDAAPSGSTLLGGYDIVLDGHTYHLVLYWRDEEASLRELGAAVSWPYSNDGESRTYRLTDYVER